MAKCDYNRRVCILVLCGLPGSGKTELTSRIEKECDRCTKIIHICYDKILPAEIEKELVQGQKEESQWKGYRKKIIQLVGSSILIHNSRNITESSLLSFDEELYQRFTKTTNYKEDFGHLENIVYIIDDNMYYRSMRYEYYQTAREYQAGYAVIYVSCPVELALKRNKQRTNSVPDDIIVTMATKLEPPDSSLHNWEKYSIVVESEQPCNMSRIYDIIQKALDNPAPPVLQENVEEKMESRRICSANDIHQADQILRKLISCKMVELKENGADKTCLIAKGKELNTVRITLLDKFKNGVIHLPQLSEQEMAASNGGCNTMYAIVQNYFQEDLKHL